MEKRCSGKCGETKSVKEFHKDRSTKDGLRPDCKICVRQYQKQYQKQARQSEKYKQAQRQYHRKYEQSEKGRQANKQAQRRYRQSEKGKQYKRRYRQSERYKQTDKRCRATRRTRETQAGGSYTPTEWFNLCKFYDFCCLKCNEKFPFEKLTLDHIKPVSKGGSSHIWNTQPLCGKCNSKKGDKEIDYRKTLPDWINRDGPVWQQDRLF